MLADASCIFVSERGLETSQQQPKKKKETILFGNIKYCLERERGSRCSWTRGSLSGDTWGREMATDLSVHNCERRREPPRCLCFIGDPSPQETERERERLGNLFLKMNVWSPVKRKTSAECESRHSPPDLPYPEASDVTRKKRRQNYLQNPQDADVPRTTWFIFGIFLKFFFVLFFLFFFGGNDEVTMRMVWGE